MNVEPYNKLDNNIIKEVKLTDVNLGNEINSPPLVWASEKI